MMDFQTPFPVKVFQYTPDGRMGYFVDGLAVFAFDVRNSKTMVEERRVISASQIAIFIYRRYQNAAAVFQIPRRVVRAAAEKGDSEWCPADNHVLP
jgi:hypothetical protein